MRAAEEPHGLSTVYVHRAKLVVIDLSSCYWIGIDVPMATHTARVTLQALKCNLNHHTIFMMKLHRGLEASAELQEVYGVTKGLSIYKQHL